MDAVDGYPEEPDGRWRRYPDRPAGAGDPRHDETYDDGYPDRYRVPEPRFGDRPRDEGFGDRGRDEGFGDRGRDDGFSRDDGYGEQDRYEQDRYDRDPRAGRDAGQTRVAAARPGPAEEPGRVAPPALRRTPPSAGPREPVAGAREPVAGPREAVVGPREPRVYTSKRPAVALLLGAVTVVAELVMVSIMGDGFLGVRFSPGAVLAGLFGMAGLPFTAIGLHALITGAAVAGDPNPARAWARAPLAYLPVGLILLLAAGAAAGP